MLTPPFPLTTGDAWDRKEIEYVQGDISDREAVLKIVEGAECVWHNAAAVGPYHPEALYTKVTSPVSIGRLPCLAWGGAIVDGS